MSQKAYVQGSAFPEIKPGVLRLYSMRFCPFAQRTRLVLEHKNIPYETVNVNLQSKPDWFLALNPLGQVPVLQLDDQVVPESTATCDWLDDVYPETRLQPSDPYRRAWDRVLLEYLSKLSGSFWAALRSTEVSETEAKLEEIQKHFQFYEDKLKARGDESFFGGSQPSTFDFMFWPMMERFPLIGILKSIPTAQLDEDRFPMLTSWVKAMKELPAVRATAFDAESHATYFRGYTTGTVDYDLFLKE